jgi:hypothetical protein
MRKLRLLGEKGSEGTPLVLPGLLLRRPWVGAPVGRGGETPHPTPQRQIFCVLQGECQVMASDGSVRRFSAGSVLLLEDTWGKGHATRVTSGEDLLIFGVALADSE